MSSESRDSSDWRRIAAEKPPRWLGDLNDDCTSDWAGFILRAEKMNKDDWWWCVYEEGSSEQIASSNDDDAAQCTSGEASRMAAENAARRLLGLHAR